MGRGSIPKPIPISYAPEPLYESNFRINQVDYKCSYHSYEYQITSHLVIDIFSIHEHNMLLIYRLVVPPIISIEVSDDS